MYVDCISIEKIMVHSVVNNQESTKPVLGGKRPTFSEDEYGLIGSVWSKMSMYFQNGFFTIQNYCHALAYKTCFNHQCTMVIVPTKNKC